MDEYEKIKQRLVEEAVSDQPTGWLSDNAGAEVYGQDEDTIEITTYEGGIAHVDVSHLASLVQHLIEEDRKAR